MIPYSGICSSAISDHGNYLYIRDHALFLTIMVSSMIAVVDTETAYLDFGVEPRHEKRKNSTIVSV